MFKLEIETDNAAFENNANREVARLLKNVIRALDADHADGLLFDFNGNKVGKWEIS